jgi:hypothetical protein
MTDWSKFTDRELFLYIRGAYDLGAAAVPRNSRNLLEADEERSRRGISGMDVHFQDLDLPIKRLSFTGEPAGGERHD